MSNTKKTVALDARYLNRPGVGIHTYLVALISLLRSEDYKITFIVETPPKNFSIRKSEGLAVLQAPNRFLWEQFTLLRYMRRHNFDIYIAPSNFGIPLLANRKTKYVLVVHDYIPIRFPGVYLFKRPLYAIQYLTSLAISLHKADLVVTNSQFTATETKELFRKDAINAYIPVKYTKYNVAMAKRAHARKTYGNYFIYNGGADPRKNVASLILGFHNFSKQHPDFRLLIMGNNFDRYIRFAKALRANNIEFLGYVSEAEKKVLLAGATALLCVSKMEGYGLPLIEAYCAGTPVITTRNSALSEIAGSAAIFLSDSTPEVLATTLEGFVKLNHKQRQAFIKKGYRRLTELNSFGTEGVIVRQIEKLVA